MLIPDGEVQELARSCLSTVPKYQVEQVRILEKRVACFRKAAHTDYALECLELQEQLLAAMKAAMTKPTTKCGGKGKGKGK